MNNIGSYAENIINTSKDILLNTFESVKNVDISNLSEKTIFELFDMDIVKIMPVVGKLFSLINVGIGIKDNFFKKKFITFYIEFQKNNIDDKKVKEYRSKIERNPEIFKKDIEILYTFIDKQIEENKSFLLANAWISRINNNISAHEFIEFIMLIDNFVMSDIYIMKNLYELKQRVVSKESDVCMLLRYMPSISRLQSMGFLAILHVGDSYILDGAFGIHKKAESVFDNNTRIESNAILVEDLFIRFYTLIILPSIDKIDLIRARYY